METTQSSPVSKTVLWIGRVMSTLPVLMLLFSATMKFMKPPKVVEGFVHLGLPEKLVLPIAILELSCTLIYMIPRTAGLGAILLTGYLGGAILAHLRLGEPIFMQVIFGVVIWGGLFLRDRKVRALIPFRQLP